MCFPSEVDLNILAAMFSQFLRSVTAELQHEKAMADLETACDHGQMQTSEGGGGAGRGKSKKRGLFLA